MPSPWNKGTKGAMKPNEGSFTSERLKGNQFAKGNKPNRTSFKKGIRYNPKTEFKKGIHPATEFKKGMKGEKCYAWKDGRSVKKSLKYREKIAGRKRSEQCEICGAMEQICFDHDHKTGEFRGWICGRCNFALGLVKDNTETLMAMIEYLRKN